MDLAGSLRFYRDMFADASRFTFVFVGDLDVDRLARLAERYLASLPSTQEGFSWNDLGVRPPEGTVHKEVIQGTDPKGRVYRVYGLPFEWDAEERTRVDAMVHILRIRLREKLRETIGGTYHAGVYSSYQHYPLAWCETRISFGCDPGKIDVLIAAMEAEIGRMQKQLVDDTYLTKAREIMQQEWTLRLEKNETWMTLLDDWAWHGEDPRVRINEYATWVNAVTAESVRETARRYLATPNVATILLRPEQEE
jgi:zinc protease